MFCEGLALSRYEQRCLTHPKHLGRGERVLIARVSSRALSVATLKSEVELFRQVVAEFTHQPAEFEFGEKLPGVSRHRVEFSILTQDATVTNESIVLTSAKAFFRMSENCTLTANS